MEFHHSRGIAVAWILAAVFGRFATVEAQGSAADYERCERIRSNVAGKLLRNHVDLDWLDDHRVVIRTEESLETWHFDLIDAARSTRETVFDHEAIASELASLLGRDFEAKALPLESFREEGDALLFRVEDEDRSFQWLGGVLTEASGGVLSEPGMPYAEGRRSISGGDSAQMSITNALDRPYEVFWLETSGAKRSYGTLEVGGVFDQSSYVGHVWLLVDAEGGELGPFIVSSSSGNRLLLDSDLREGQPSVEAEPPGERDVISRRSPDGLWEIRFRGDNVELVDLATKDRRRLTEDGTKTDAYRAPVVWSPDSKFVAVQRVVPGEEHRIHWIETAPRDRREPKLHSNGYTKPGDRIDQRRYVILDVTTGTRVEPPADDFRDVWRLTQFDWSPDGSEFRMLINMRGHERLRYVGIHRETGQVRDIIDESLGGFLDYSNKLYLEKLPVEGGLEPLIWMSERSGWNHLWRIDAATGRVLNPITSGEWAVLEVDEVDPEAETIRFQASSPYADQSPYHVHHGRVNFDGTGLTWLTEGDGTHTIRSSPGGQYWIDRYSRVDLPAVHELRRNRDGGLVVELARADDTALREIGWRRPERFRAKGRDGVTDIWGAIFLPSNFDPSQVYPVIENIYAGPHTHTTPVSYRLWHREREMAELGFVVVHIDGMGTNGRSRAFHQVAWKNLGDAGFPDRIAWMKAAAATRPYMDLDRVGIYGGSAGGQNAMRALLSHGDFYDAAVADCGCHDNRMDKIWWNELWMGWPIDEEVYDRSSNVVDAHRLQGELLLIVGEMDTNVDPASTMQVVDALVRADLDFELLVIPGGGHGIAESPYGHRRRRDFFVRHLLNKTPRW